MNIEEHNSTDNFLRWFAGFIDGEGSFGIYKNKNNTKWKAFSIVIVLQERDGFVLNEIKKQIGGLRGHRKRQKSWKRNCHEQEVWYVRNMIDCLRVAKLIEPFLILKKEVCQRFIIQLSEYMKFAKPKKGHKRDK